MVVGGAISRDELEKAVGDKAAALQPSPHDVRHNFWNVTNPVNREVFGAATAGMSTDSIVGASP